ncbi:MAG: nucleoside hydrolase [Propionibacteriales bacterium]|nr:nucleoside hydrolase [Propionibacteriales bacterium]
MKLHLDTDFAGDPDDAAALAMLLGFDDVHLTGITTVADPDGRRAAYVRRMLALAGSTDIPVAPGARISMTHGAVMGDIPDHARYWGSEPLWAQQAETGCHAALDLLAASVETGATVVAIGPMTNLALLAQRHPGHLARAHVVAMGGWFAPVAPGLPCWGPAADWNVQCDTAAAVTVLQHAGRLTLVPLSMTIAVFLRLGEVDRLCASGRIGRLLARQAIAYCVDEGKAEIARAHDGLPDDLLNFHHDPLTCATATGWGGVEHQTRDLVAVHSGDVLSFEETPDGRSVDVVTAVDSLAFGHTWLAAVEAADRRTTVT